jgi:acetyl esterase/lipase
VIDRRRGRRSGIHRPGIDRTGGIDRRSFMLLTAALASLRLPAAGTSTFTAPPAPARVPDAWNRAETVALWPGLPPGGEAFVAQTLPSGWSPGLIRNVAMPALHIFRPAAPNGRGVLVIPGGAYLFVSVLNEGLDIAERMNALGFTVFVLTYRLPGEGWVPRAEVPLQDAQRSVRLIRSQAGAFGIAGDALTVLGFSAGGHLAATLATEHAKTVYTPVDSIDRQSARPLAAALIYPVVTMLKPWTHEQSRRQLLGPDPSDDAIAAHSPELHVDAGTPPMFLAHAFDDASVSVDNSIRLMDALRSAGRPVEAHLFQEGNHAFGVGYAGTPSSQWIDLLSIWLQRIHTTTPVAR